MSSVTTDRDDGPVRHASDGVTFVDGPLPPAPREATSYAFSDELKPVRARTRAWAAEHGLPDRLRDDLILAVDELAANSVRHGGGRGELHLWLDGRSVTAQVADGGWIRDRSVGRSLPPIDQVDGRGLFIVGALAGRFEVCTGPGGTVVRARFDP
jgi:anti-sigma regulatory factor (Ser/Thr protein kinase)